MTQPFVTLTEIQAAHARIKPHVRRTFTTRSASLGAYLGQPVHLKLEHQQITGSFKLRGAMNAVLSLDETTRARGIVAVSTGNHGRALAHAARAVGARATICMSTLVPQAKIDGIAALGADIRIIGASQDEAQYEVDRLIADEGFATIPPFDNRHVIAGQGTLGLELLDDLPELATVLVQVSGGGLVSGVAAALKARKPDVRIIGVSMARGAAMHASLAAGKPVEVPELPTLADSLGGGIGLDNHLTFAMTRALVDDIVLLSEDEIAAGIRHCYEHEGQIVEGAGAVGVAAVLAGKIDSTGPLGIILSGGNIDMGQHQRLICGDPV
ncbi:hydroxyectoine utilization dehydratase EutB [Pacificibacter marinus]|uniref:L-threonine dehydratase catabolic TdcB n=1 Tax=Pacificibacter marinus TaxID=658057 RepID=A0A1Y5RSL6_9RHOB|nr:hydroxyectoine utilization dehydratase EutB [Pacificibacter marinus]SEK41929.1 threonine dehydratase [Pacificibacter marinus]SLN24533.1 L-threonine dehydratase catabolic TdcB [Pacificibacter marinus]